MKSFARCAALTAVLAAAGVVARPAAAEELKWKFEAGKTFYQTANTDMVQKMTIMGQDIDQTQKMVMYMSWTPVKQEGADWLIKQTLLGMRMEMKGPAGRMVYDSTDPAGSDPNLGKILGAMVGAEFTITLSPDMKVTKVTGVEEVLEKAGKDNPAAKQALQQFMSTENMRQSAEQYFGVVPDKAVSKGDSWTRENKMSLGPLGGFKNVAKYTYEGKEGGLDKVSITPDLKFEPPAAGAGGALPFTLKGGELKSTEAAGWHLFDPAKGRVEKMEMKMKLEGKLTIEAGGQTADLGLHQVSVVTVTTSDTNPLPKK